MSHESLVNRTLLSPVVLPYTRRELPGWGYVVKLAGGFSDSLWSSAPPCEIRCKWSGYGIVLQPSDAFERYVYFIGRYYDLPTQLLLKEILRPGDTFIDIGANIGAITLLGASCVGPSGRVIAFEPNPEVFRRLEENVRRNQLRHVQPYAVGLANSTGRLVLTRITPNTVHGSFCPPRPEEQPLVTSSYEAPVDRGDAYLADLPCSPMTVKIDVEGFECHVLRGLEQTLRNHTPVVITEVVERHLRRAGSRVQELFGIMEDHGYRAYSLETKRAWLRYRLRLRPTTTAEEVTGTDVIWLHPACIQTRRLPESVFLSRRSMRPPGVAV